MNRTHNKYSRSEIEAFIEDHLKEGAFTADAQAVSNSEDFESLSFPTIMLCAKTAFMRLLQTDPSPFMQDPTITLRFIFKGGPKTNDSIL